MITEKQKELIKMLEWEINNIENALKNNRVERYMIPLMKYRIEKKKNQIKDIEQYKRDKYFID